MYLFLALSMLDFVSFAAIWFFMMLWENGNRWVTRPLRG
jgi:hypothetical protein